jgi:hypothetical protein
MNMDNDAVKLKKELEEEGYSSYDEFLREHWTDLNAYQIDLLKSAGVINEEHEEMHEWHNTKNTTK